MSFPGATENVQWGEDLVFKVAGKMFSVVGLAAGAMGGFSFKSSEEKFHELTEMPGITPAPYLARAHWVRIEPRECRLSDRELQELLREAYDLIVAKLPKKTREELKQVKHKRS